jgi:hypothetical protein
VLLVGNVHGVGQVDGQRQVAQPAPEAHFYIVKRGDTLSKIAAAGSGAGDTRTPTCTADHHAREDLGIGLAAIGGWLLILMVVHL